MTNYLMINQSIQNNAVEYNYTYSLLNLTGTNTKI